MYAKVKQSKDGLLFYSSYDAGLVASLKYEIPSNMRQWNPNKTCWIVDNSQLNMLKDIVKDHLGVDLHVPVGVGSYANPNHSTRLIRVEYIGQIKDRGNGELSAYGARFPDETKPYQMLSIANQQKLLMWDTVFPEQALKKWFLGGNAKDTPNMSTFYTVLAIQQSTPQKEIKTAWRKMVKRYHPDKNSDVDAADMTIKINEAYNILRNPTKRKKYDAGLKLQSSLGQSVKPIRGSGFNIPVRCGMILAKGHDSVGRFIVDEILEWTDIVENGRTLITSWNLSTNSLRREWI